jgi:molybdate transport system substrate-binding protein
MNAFFRTIVICLTGLLMVSCEKKPTEPVGSAVKPGPSVTVAAAASLTGVLEELVPAIKAQTGIDLKINPGASGALAQQIIQGAPVDLFISANTKWMNELQKQDRVDAGTRIDLLRNELVLVAGTDVKDAPESLEALGAFTGRLAIGERESVPAGQYAEQALTSANLWEVFQDRLVPGVDVRAVLAYVESGAVPIGIVYATDAASSKSTRVLFAFPESLHDPIVYPAAVLRDARDAKAAGQVLEFLQSAEARKVFDKAGFRSAVSAGVN